MEKLDAEEVVGIGQFLYSHTPIMFAYKYRFSDFVVHEIGTDGNRVPYVKEDLESSHA